MDVAGVDEAVQSLFLLVPSRRLSMRGGDMMAMLSSTSTVIPLVGLILLLFFTTVVIWCFVSLCLGASKSHDGW